LPKKGLLFKTENLKFYLHHHCNKSLNKFSVQQKILLAIAPGLGKLFIYLLAKSCKIVELNCDLETKLLSEFRNYIIAFWHGRQLMLVYTHRDRDIHVLVSRSFDGELISRTLNKFGNFTTRGSSSHGGKQALEAVISLLKSNKIVAFTPDGPKGPPGSVAPGIIAAASATGKPILPLSVGAQHKFHLKSWDRFMIPRPFTKVVIIAGNPVIVPPGIPSDRIDEYSNTLKAEIDRISQIADHYFD
jgi:lysophospholipid acyltransferase (LPLAT)-like uncharacterized protein